MTTLELISTRLGQAMGLPQVFFKPLPLPTPIMSILDMPVPLPGFLVGGRRWRRARKLRKAAARQQSPAASRASFQFMLEGPLTPGQGAKFAVDGTDFIISPATWIVGELRLGAQVRVKGQRNMTDEHLATSIIITDPVLQ